MSSDSLLLSNLKGLANHLADTIFLPDQNRVYSILDKIVERNAALQGMSDIASKTIFYFGGGLYHHSSNKKKSPIGVTKLALSQELEPEMVKYQQEFQQLSQDYARVRQFIVVQVAGVQTEQSIRNNLPDSVIPLTGHQTLMNLNRTVPIEETHKHKEGTLAEKQFLKTLEIIDSYVAMRYIL